MKPLLFVLISLIFFSIGEIFSKFWAESKNIKWAIFVLVAYLIGTALWLPAIAIKNHLTSLGTIWNVGALLCTILIGAVLFHETVSNTQWIGIGMALIASVLLSIE